MKTQVLKFGNTHVGDVLKLSQGYFDVKVGIAGLKCVKGEYFAEDTIVERVITQNPLVRLKRYLIG